MCVGAGRDAAHSASSRREHSATRSLSASTPPRSLTLTLRASRARPLAANDLANSFGTVASSRALKMWQIVILAGICEFLGAVLLCVPAESAVDSERAVA